MTFEFRGNDRENFNKRLTELPELDASLSALIVPYNPIREISRLPASLAVASLRGCEVNRLQFLAGCPNLVALDVSGNSLNHQGGMDLANYLANTENTRKLQKLHFSACHIPSSALLHIVRALETVPNLRDVDMSRNAAVVSAANGELVTSEGVELQYHLENLFRRSCSIKTANLGFMTLGDEGVAAVLSGISRNPQSAVSSLDLSGNRATWQAAGLVNKICRASDRKPTLENLNLSANRLGQNATAAAVAELAQALTDKAHCGLKTLDLSKNQLTGEALVSIVSAAARSSLKKLHIFENRWSREVARNLVNVVQSCPVVLDFAIQTVDNNVYVVRK